MRRLAPVLLLMLTSGCALQADTAVPGCGDVERVALVAQAVPAASYVPCLRELPVGWRATAFEVHDGAGRIALRSDRGGDRDVEVVLTARCDVAGASPTAPRAAGVRSYLRMRSVSPVWTGTAYDVFAGGCVRSDFAFPRGAHIPLMEDLAEAVTLVPRRELRLELRDRLGVELDP